MSQVYSLAPTTSSVRLQHETFTITANISGAAQAQSKALQCWSDIMTWRSESASWYDATIANRTWPITTSTSVDTEIQSYTTLSYPSNTSVYTLCDGFPRVDAGPSTAHLVTTELATITVRVLATPTFRPKPCTPSPEDCQLWYEDSNIPMLDVEELERECGVPAHGNGPCIFAVSGAVQLYYFPVPTANGSLCASNRSTVTAVRTGTAPIEMTTDGYTFTSGSVYLSLESLYAYYDGFFNTVGPTYSNVFLTLQSSDISTQCQGSPNNTLLNYADLNWPVPASAYSCQARCGYAGMVGSTACNTIWNDLNPALAIPTKALKAMVPEWSNCVAGDGNQAQYWFDPPVTLQPRSAVASATLSTEPKTTPAAPSSAVSDQLPSATSDQQPSSTVALTASTASIAQPSGISETGQSSANDLSSSTLSIDRSSSPAPIAQSTSVSETGQTSVNDPSFSASSIDRSSSPASISTGVPAPPPSSGTTETLAASALPSGPVLSMLSQALASYPQASSSSPAPVEAPGPPDTASSPSASRTVAVFSQGGTVITALESSNAAIIGTHTIPIGQAATVSGIYISADSSGLIVGSVVAPLSDPLGTASSPSASRTVAVISQGGTAITALVSSNAAIIGTQTISIGQAATVSGIYVSADSSGLIIGSAVAPFTIISLPGAVPDDPRRSTTTANSLTLTAPAIADLILVPFGGTVLSGGASPTTIDGQTVSQGSDAVYLLSGSRTIPFTAAGSSGAPLTPNTGYSTEAAGSATLAVSFTSRDGTSAAVLGSVTLSVGGPAATVSGFAVSLGSSGLVLLGSQSLTFSNAGLPSVSTLPSPGLNVLAAGSLTVTASALSGSPKTLAVDGTLLSQGGPAETANGKTVSVGSSGLVLIDAQTTVTFSTINGGSATTTSANLPLVTTAAGSSIPSSSAPKSTSSSKSAAGSNNGAGIPLIALEVVAMIVFLRLNS